MMVARGVVKHAKADEDAIAEAVAHKVVDQIMRALGERGPVWWKDGTPDFNRHLAKNSPYASWYAGLWRRQRAGR